MKKIILSIMTLAIAVNDFAFCGFYVAKADTKLFNKTSQVILVRNGDKTTITMSSDFEGNVKDFAMVVPVPVVLQQSDIRVADRLLFDKLDAYSSPRLVEYYDANPCYKPQYDYYDMAPRAAAGASMQNEDSSVKMNMQKDYGVTIQAKYTVGEYDILILSAKESGGLEDWLTDNGYKIPAGAKEVLEPYIKNNMKFFVAKVNLQNYNDSNATPVPLRPLQITFNSDRFMLPIRLGMANADGPQDLVVYGFSNVGRIETTNYRTVDVPTGQNVPLFVQGEFGEFYKDLYNKAWKRNDQNVVFLEYAWDISSSVTTYCDPCTGTPPMLTDLQGAGVDWVQNYHYGYAGNVYFTRLHVTYQRNTFPQDLFFQETPNKQNFQARYVLTHPAEGPFDCDESQAYLHDLNKRRWDEMYTYQWLSGRDISKHLDYPSEYNKFLKKKSDGQSQGSLTPDDYHYPGNNGSKRGDMTVPVLSLITFSAMMFALSRKRNPVAPSA